MNKDIAYIKKRRGGMGGIPASCSGSFTFRPRMDYPDRDISWISLGPTGKCQDITYIQAMIAPFHILSNSIIIIIYI
jgi:hypothetical protein